MKKKFKTIVRDLDMFGKPISLTFDKASETHNTICGGILSIFILISLFSFLVFRIYVMLNYL